MAVVIKLNLFDSFALQVSGFSGPLHFLSSGSCCKPAHSESGSTSCSECLFNSFVQCFSLVVLIEPQLHCLHGE